MRSALSHPSALCVTLAILLSGPNLVSAQVTGTLSGQWTLDRSRSLPPPPGSFDRQLTITAEAGRVVLEDFISGPQGPAHLVDTMTIGPVVPFVLKGAGGLEAPGTRRVYWGDSGKLEVRDSVLLDGPTGPYTRQTEQSWSVTQDGSRLVVETLRKFALFSVPIHTEYTRK